jgi:hypothetical protein
VCTVGGDRDCQKAAVCTMHGLCAADGRRCLAATRQHCRAATICRDFAACTLQWGRCTRDERCAEPCFASGRCEWSEEHEGCVAFSDALCSASARCEEDGECFFDGDYRCDRGEERRNRGAFAGGLTVIGLGGAAILGGVVALVVGAFGSTFGDSDEETMIGGGIAMSAGAGFALVIGMPLTIYGGGKVKRRQPAMHLSPAGAGLVLRF